MTKTVIFGVGMAVAAVLTACGGGGSDAGASPTPSEASPTPSNAQRPTSTAELTILEPKLGATVPGPNVDIVVQIQGATLLGEASRDLRPDTGHIHVSVNDRVDTLLAGERYTIEDLDPGQYIIKVEFAAADHGSFSPPVIETVKITVT